MDQLALYREWRPQSFRDVVGQEHVCRTLRNAIVLGRLAHAYLFCGPRGTGKTSTARILAKAANCQNSRGGEPCNSCDSCRSITAGTAFDVLEMDAASHRGIEEIRELRQKVGFAPTSGRFKFYIIDEVHMLTGEAFNALLKTLEEPPRHTVFVLATTEAHKVPATILSRCQRFDFRRLSREQIAAHLKRVASEKGWEVEPEALKLIARIAGGALRDALGLLDQAVSYGGGHVRVADVEALTGTPGRDMLDSLLEAVYQGRIPVLLEQLEGLFVRGYDPRQVLYQLTDCVRDALFSRHCPEVETEWYALALRSLAEADAVMRGHIRPDLALELALLRLADASPFRKGKTGGLPTEPPSNPLAEKPPASGERDGLKEEFSGGGYPGGMGSDAGLPEPPHGGSTGPHGRTQPDSSYDLDALRRFLQSRFRKQPLMGNVLTAAEIRQAGRKIRISAPPPFGVLLQKEENRRCLQDALREFDRGLELEIGENSPVRGEAGDASPGAVSVGTNRLEEETERRDASAEAEEGLDPVVGAALSLFKGKLIKRREDGD